MNFTKALFWGAVLLLGSCYGQVDSSTGLIAVGSIGLVALAASSALAAGVQAGRRLCNCEEELAKQQQNYEKQLKKCEEEKAALEAEKLKLENDLKSAQDRFEVCSDALVEVCKAEAAQAADCIGCAQSLDDSATCTSDSKCAVQNEVCVRKSAMG